MPAHSITPTILRQLVADALYPTSANHLPSVCAELGMASGTVQEAFKSKTQYVLGRLQGMSFDNVLTTARRVVSAHPRYELQEAIAKIDDVASPAISSLTRRHLLKALNAFQLGGDDGLLEFLRRFWPIDRMAWLQSDTSESDPFVEFVSRHAIANDDISNEEILEQLDARTCSQTLFFRFVEALVHPEIRSGNEQSNMVEVLNKILSADGFVLAPGQPISGYPTFTVGRLPVGTPADSSISEVLAAFDEEGVHTAWRKALERRSSDPEAAITTARSLLETVCRHIIESGGATPNDKDDLPQLYRNAAKMLKLAPDQHTEETFKSILGSCQNIVNGLGTLRNKLSDAHGHGRRPVRPSARHAELAVNLAGSMAMFLISTWIARAQEAS